MTTINPALKLILNISKVKATTSRRLDGQLGFHGLSFSDFIILYHLDQAAGGKLRRIDLADKLGVTASGVTRMLAPMEKIGLVSKESNEHDARISYVVLAPGGKRLFEESLKTAEHVASEIFSAPGIKKVEKLDELLNEVILIP
jgi:DNA-binding MarR family transcriptional regulator